MNKSCRISLLALFLLFCLSGPLWTADGPAPQENKAVPEEVKAAPPQETKVAPQEAPAAPEEAKAAPEEVKIAPDPNIEKTPDVSMAVDPGSITVNFKGADIKTILAYISEVSGVDIVPAPDVKGVVDMKLTNKPWKVALDIILRTYGFAYEREGDIIRVVTVSQLKQEELASQTYNLNYSKSKDVVTAIKNILSDKGKVTYDDRTNTVIVTDIPTNLYKISQVIAKLDRRTQQVLIEARVIETVLSDTEKLGIDWNVKISAAGAKRPITFPFDEFNAAMQFLPQVQTAAPTVGASTATTSSVNLTSTFPSDATGVQAFPFAGTDQFSFGTLDFTQFSAVLEMLKSRAKTDVVSNPRIATLNNQEAIINVGQTLNMPKYERNSSTGKMEITGYDAKDLGIILKVTPHINELNEIVVDLAPQITDLLRYDTLDATSGVVAPVFSVRIAKTQVMVKDGQTIFIGGLIKENDVNGKKKLPFIGDLFEDVPLLGLLTSKKETTKQKTELIFFISVNIMTDDREIGNLPKSEKVYNPAFTLIKTQEQATAEKKGKKK